LVFLLFFFHLVSPEILSLRSYRHTFLLDDQPILVFLLYCCYSDIQVYVSELKFEGKTKNRSLAKR
jgi:hypothetical protein